MSKYYSIKIVVIALLLCFCKFIFAQDNNVFIEKPALSLLNIRTNNSKNISLGSKVKCNLYISNKKEKGRLLGVNDSSLIINRNEIKYVNIKSIQVVSGLTVPIKVLGVIMFPFTSGLSLLLVTNRYSSDYYNLNKYWKFTSPVKSGVDSLEINKFIKKAERDSFFQNHSSGLFVTLNPLNSLFNQHSVELGYQFNKNFYFGIEGGIIKSNYWWNKNHRLYNGTDDWFPAGYYNGWMLSAHIKRFNFTANNWFIEVAPIFKYLTYSKVHFFNSFGDPNPDVQWIRSEKMTVLGVKLMMGKRLFITRHFILEAFFGVSIRGQYRSYITYWTSHVYYPLNVEVNRIQGMPGAQAGLKFSIGNFKHYINK